jgi:hypothetical protein
MSRQVVEHLHEAMHRLPGMPDHAEAERLHARAAHTNRHSTHSRRHLATENPTVRHQRQPRVLVGWQKAIGALFDRSNT